MIINVSRSGDVSVSNPDDFRAFAVAVEDSTAAATFSAAAASIGGATEDGGHVYVAPDRLVALVDAQRGVDPDWTSGFHGMVAYAESHGWVDDRGWIRAHVEPSAPNP
ncbi:hypothetical protein GCM10023094_32980 [Rhodococcus olei]|uniref:Excreted virulence factor EspC (Type VII ESX diderm) n=1 Tax=Rhodococcus olei TaxID=2161675 RepID=A0ABP8P9F0_9NOCA